MSTRWVFSRQSYQHLFSAHPNLIEVADLALACSPVDFGISCGFRGEDAQIAAFGAGKSKLTWPNSLHNHMPSSAVDFFPCIDGRAAWERKDLFFLIAGLMLGIADCLGYRLRWGGAWDGVVNEPGQWSDLPHIELVRR